MSKGFGKVQKKVIRYLEEHYTDQRDNIIKALSDEHRGNSIYRAIQRLMKRHEDSENPESPGVIYETKQKSLNPQNRPKNQISKFIKLNTNHPDYLKYKNKKG